MDFHFKLMLYCEKEGRKEKRYAGDILQESILDTAGVHIDRDSSTIDLVYQGVTYISDSWNLGRPDWLLPQLKNAVDKITNAEPVFVRSAVIEGSEIPYIFFDPDAQFIKISMIIFADYEIEQIFPSGPFSENSSLLYNYFEDNREILYNHINDVIRDNAGYTETFKELIVPARAILESLNSMIQEIEQLFMPIS